MLRSKTKKSYKWTTYAAETFETSVSTSLLRPSWCTIKPQCYLANTGPSSPSGYSCKMPLNQSSGGFTPFAPQKTAAQYAVNSQGMESVMHLFFPLYFAFIVSPAGRWLLETCSRSGPSLQMIEALDLCFNPIEQMIWISDLSQPPQLTAFQ